MKNLLIRGAVLVFAVTLFSLLKASPAYADTTHCGTISANETWSSTDNVHIMTCDVTVGPGVTLTITEGAIVKFDIGQSLLVNGNNSALRLLGTPTNAITVTSIRDDTVGGDTNNDGSTTTPARGDWRRIEFGVDSNDATALIENAIIRYGGGNDCCTNYGALTFTDASPTVRNSTVRDSLHYAYLANLGSFPTLNANTLINNGINGLALSGGALNMNATWNVTDTAYYLRDDISLGVGTTLTVTPDVIVKFELGRSLLVSGVNSALRVLGTSGNPVSFTSLRDDTVGNPGDTNNNGAGTVPARGDWRRIEFGVDSNDATALIENAIIRYGGGNDCCTNYGALTFTDASPTVRNSTVRDNLHYSIAL